jgi:Ca-activated chloride channel family protein
MNAASALGAWFLVVMACPGIGAAGDEPGGAERASRTLAPYFFVENGDPSVDQVPLEATTVDVVVSGVIANVRVTQVYVNRGSRPIHARYVFPGSTRAAVHGMTMTIGDRRVVARIQEREAARATYEKARSEGKSASLLEQSRPNVFSMRVANILPGDRIEVELKYTELLAPEERVYEFVFPTVVGPRYSNQEKESAPERDHFVASPYLREGVASKAHFDIRVALDAGVPMHELTCPSHKTWTEWEGTSKATVRLDPQGSEGGNRDFILRYRLAGERIASGVLLYQGQDEGFFLVMAQPPERVAPSDIPPREYIFVVDVSGSMSGFPLDTAKTLLHDLIGRLEPTDTFNVLLFSGGSHLLSPRSLPATAANVAQAVRIIDDQTGGGGTELRDALDRAVNVPRANGFARSVVLVTDGYISAEADVFGLIAANLGRTNFFAFGIGTSVNRHLIEGVARAGQGEPFVVTGPEEAALVSDRFRRYIESPVLTQISIAAEGFDAYDLEPAGFPDLLAERPLVALGKWRGAPAGRIVIRGESGSGPYEQVIDVGAIAPSAANQALSQLWARARVAALADFGLASSAEAHRPEIVSLGLKYNLLTSFTSFVAVLEVVRNPGGGGDDVNQPLPLPDGVSNAAVGMTQASEPDLVLVLLALALLALGIRIRSGRPWAAIAGTLR